MTKKKTILCIVLAAVVVLAIAAGILLGREKDDTNEAASEKQTETDVVSQETTEPVAPVEEKVVDTSYTTETVSASQEGIAGDCHFEKLRFTNPNAALSKINDYLSDACDTYFSAGAGKDYCEQLNGLEEENPDLLQFSGDFAATEDVDEVYIGSDYISIRMSTSWYMGGCVSSGYDCYHFDAQTGEPITLMEFFGSAEQGKSAIVAAVEGYMDSHKEIEFNSDAMEIVRGTEVNDFKFSFDADNVAILFDKYEIANGSVGSIAITIAR